MTDEVVNKPVCTTCYSVPCRCREPARVRDLIALANLVAGDKRQALHLQMAVGLLSMTLPALGGANIELRDRIEAFFEEVRSNP